MKGVAKNSLTAVIEIGATGIRLTVAQLDKSGNWAVIDKAERFVALGRDVFTTGELSRESATLCLTVLNDYKELLKCWRLEPADVQVIATTAFRRAKNRDIRRDRIFLKTGFSVRVIDGIEENRLMYLSVKYALGDNYNQFFSENSIIMDIGGGSTEVMLLQKGKTVSAHSLSLGTVFIENQAQAMMGSEKYIKRYLQEYIRNTSENFSKEMPFSQITHFVGTGSEMAFVAKKCGTEKNDYFSVILRKDFEEFVDKLLSYTTDENVRRLGITYTEAETLLPALLTYKLFITQTSTEYILVTNLSIREGLLISLTSGPDDSTQEEFYSQVVASAINLGNRFKFDENHSLFVTNFALALFDFLKEDHGLNRHSRLLLEIAGILHDIGSYIRADDHHLHSCYIINNSDIFGLGKDGMSVISLVAGYHRGNEPSVSDSRFNEIPRNDRVQVLKLSAILRIADAMDRSHTQKITKYNFEKKQDFLVINTSGNHDLTLEQFALTEKGLLFQSVFGYKVILV